MKYIKRIITCLRVYMSKNISKYIKYPPKTIQVFIQRKYAKYLLDVSKMSFPLTIYIYIYKLGDTLSGLKVVKEVKEALISNRTSYQHVGRQKRPLDD